MIRPLTETGLLWFVHVLFLYLVQSQKSQHIESIASIGGADRTFACKSQECLWQDWYIFIYNYNFWRLQICWPHFTYSYCNIIIKTDQSRSCFYFVHIRILLDCKGLWWISWEISLPVALLPYKGHFALRFLVWPLGSVTSIFPTRGVEHYSKPYLEFRNAEAFE